MTERLTITHEDTRPKIDLTLRDLPVVSRPEHRIGLDIMEGEPWKDFYEVPDVPHVHWANVRIRDEDGETITSESARKILVAHGIKGKNGEWTFKDGRRVEDVIWHYNRQNPDYPIEIAAVCNPTNSVDRSVAHGVNSLMGVSGYRENNMTVIDLSLLNQEGGFIFNPEDSRRKKVKNAVKRTSNTLLKKIGIR